MDSHEIKFRRQHPRLCLGLKLEDVGKRWKEAFPEEATAPDPGKISKWENSEGAAQYEFCRQLRDFYARCAALEKPPKNLDVELKAMMAAGAASSEAPATISAAGVSPVAPVNFGLMYAPDSAAFAAVMEALPETQLFTKRITSAQFREVPRMILDPKEEGIQLALYPYEALKRDPLYKGPSDKDSPFHVKPIMRLRGNAVLCAARAGWKTLNQHYMENEGKHHTRQMRIRHAMWKVAEQMIEKDLTLPDFCVPGADSNRAKAMVKLLTIAREGYEAIPRDANPPPLAGAMKKLNEWIVGLQKESEPLREGEPERAPITGGEAYRRFAAALVGDPGASARERAVLPAGLTQRLLAEEMGAAPLIDCDDLQTLAALNPTEYQPLFLPTNVLIWKRGNQSLAEPMKALRRAWNRHVVAFRDSKSAPVGPLVDRFMQKAIEGKEGETPTPAYAWRPWANLFQKLIDEQLIEFLYWAEEPGGEVAE